MRARQNRWAAYADRLDDTPWLTVLGYAWVSFMGLAMLHMVMPV